MMIKKLLRAIGAIGIIPLIYAIGVLTITLSDGFSLSDAVGRILIELSVLVSTPWAIRHGRYPTLPELNAIDQSDKWIGVALMLLSWMGLSALLIIVCRVISRHAKKLPRKAVVAGLFLAPILVTAWLAGPTLLKPATAIIKVSVDRSTGPITGFSHSYSQGGHSQMKQTGYIEKAMDRLSVLQPRYVRIDHIFDYYDILTIDAAGRPHYRWDAIDRVIDAVFNAGAEPLICLSYTPPDLSPTGNAMAPPDDLTAWAELVYQTVHHLNGERGLNIHYWEVWNEPNTGNFWTGTLDDYLALYRATVQGAKRADPSIQVGGPATYSSLRLGPALSLVHEQVWVTGLIRFAEANNLPLDFVSWHLYDKNPLHYLRSAEEHRQWTAKAVTRPALFLTEWNWDSATAAEMDDSRTVAYAAATVATLSSSPLELAFFFEPIDGSDGTRGEWGMLRADATAKPIYHAFRLINELTGERLWTSSNHPDVGILASKEGDKVNILLWNYSSSRDPLSADLTIQGVRSDEPVVASVYGVDSRQEAVSWQQVDGSLLLETFSIDTPADEERLSLSIPGNGIRLVQIEVE